MNHKAMAHMTSVYERRRQRTVSLVSASIAVLEAKRVAVTINSIREVSRSLDPAGRGLSHTAILRNAEAYNLYSTHASHEPRRARTVTYNMHWSRELKKMKSVKDVSAKRKRLDKSYRKNELIELVIALLDINSSLESKIFDYFGELYDGL